MQQTKFLATQLIRLDAVEKKKKRRATQFFKESIESDDTNVEVESTYVPIQIVTTDPIMIQYRSESEEKRKIRFRIEIDIRRQT